MSIANLIKSGKTLEESFDYISTPLIKTDTLQSQNNIIKLKSNIDGENQVIEHLNHIGMDKIYSKNDILVGTINGNSIKFENLLTDNYYTRVNIVSDISIPSGYNFFDTTNNLIQVDLDLENNWNVENNEGYFLVPKSGIYNVCGHIKTDNTLLTPLVRVKKNGVEVQTEYKISEVQKTSHNGSIELYLEQGDKIYPLVNTQSNTTIYGQYLLNNVITKQSYFIISKK